MVIRFPLGMLEDDYIELVKLLKATGVCPSGGIAGVAIADGKVRVDGNVELRKRAKIRAGQRVEYKGKTIEVHRA